MAEDTPALTPRMKHTLSRAAALARASGHDYVGTEHLILALIEDPGGIAGGYFALLAVTTSLVYRRMARALLT